jgi:hypothetical protein
MFFVLIASVVGMAYFHLKSTGRLAGALSLAGFLLIMALWPMYRTTIGEYSFARGMLLVGLAFLLLGNPGRWVSILWLLASFLSFREFMHFRSGLFHSFIIFNAALLASGIVLIWQAGRVSDDASDVQNERSQLSGA